ncbi:DUF1905 domain-containing protein [Microbacterium xanthum]|uniref:DUF1905 domain-containing protein n=1 Tax=Microbacterium xanthum TaxID=3079794 RepID=UPI002AD47E40|nr:MULTISPECIES: DUF1905 domain-containing protein [unclassified Microbacterium]MDZ8172483.1 DUF1905 domain-containing protein [Microbacterium sp. KSW-48]MDZ8202680.1 DUF1905 domain-containing protein [Microbacterium sp. SSW1-59]
MNIEFDAELWLWDARNDSSWYFVTVPPGPSEDIREFPRPSRGFGSVKVRVEIGGSRWETSIFPDTSSGCFVLPIKKSVRQAEGLDVGNPTRVRLSTWD